MSHVGYMHGLRQVAHLQLLFNRLECHKYSRPSCSMCKFTGFTGGPIHAKYVLKAIKVQICLEANESF